MRRTQTNVTRRRLTYVIIGSLLTMFLCVNYYFLSSTKNQWLLDDQGGLAAFFGGAKEQQPPAPLGRIPSLFQKERLAHLTSVLQPTSKEIVSKSFFSRDLLQDIRMWVNVVATAALHGPLPNSDSSADELHYFADCWNDKDWFRLNGDPLCTYLWLRELQHGRIRYLDRILGVVPRALSKQMQEEHKDMMIKAAQNGGMRCIFENLLLNPTFNHKPEDLEQTPSTQEEDQQQGGGSNGGVPANALAISDAKTTSSRKMALEARSVKLDPYLMGYWKPCSGNVAGNSEDFRAEIVAFYIDRLLGFFRTPAVAPYTFEGHDLDRLAVLAKDRGPLGAAQLFDNPTLYDKDAPFKLETVTNFCGRVGSAPVKKTITSDPRRNGVASNNGAEGAMVGWSNFKINLVSKHNNLKQKTMIEFGKIDQEDKAAVFDVINSLNVSNHISSPEQIKRTLEIVTVHMFAILVGNMGKFGHNVFILQRNDAGKDYGVEFGPFFYVDNDRSKWSSDVISSRKVKPDDLITKVCKFPRSVALKMLNLDSSMSAVTLGSLVLEASLHHDRFLVSSPIFTAEQAKVLDKNAAFLTSAIRSCIQQYGVDQVLIEEPWSVSYTDTFSADPIFSRLSSHFLLPRK